MAAKWEYLTRVCWFDKVKGKKDEGRWVMCGPSATVKTDLNSALDALGDYGWELVAVQQRTEGHGTLYTDWDYLSFLYVFKRPTAGCPVPA